MKTKECQSQWRKEMKPTGLGGAVRVGKEKDTIVDLWLIRGDELVTYSRLG